MTSLDDKRRVLKRQIESILDTTTEKFSEVIIKAGSPSENEGNLSRMLIESMRKRSMANSPRDVLPVERKLLSTKKGSRSVAASASGSLSLAAQASAMPRRSTTEGLKKTILDAMNPILESDIVKESIGRLGKRAEGLDLRRTFWTSGSFFTKMDETGLLALRDSDLVSSLEGIFPNRRVALPPVVAAKHIPSLVEDNKVSAWGTRAIGALAVWGAFNARGKGIKIGLLDTGVDPNHPDLYGKIANWAEFDSSGAEVMGSVAHDSDRHGTHCAGTIVGGNRSGRWIGVAPEAELAAALVLNGKDGGTDAQILAGIEWAIDQGVDVINMSLGGLIWGPEVPSTYTSAIHNALLMGIPVVTAVGNEGSQTSGSPGNDCFAFTVGATDSRSRAAGFSGGRTQVIRTSTYLPRDMLPLIYSKPDLSAPGMTVYSSVPGGSGNISTEPRWPRRMSRALLPYC